MKITIKVTEPFKRQAKPLLKKYHSLKSELYDLEKILLENPSYGESLESNLYKIRVAVESKGKGKSGGVRVISFLELEIIGKIEIEEKKTIVNLIAIYDKSETENIIKSDLIKIIKDI